MQLEIHVLGEIEEDASWFNKQTHVKVSHLLSGHITNTTIIHALILRS